MKCYLVSHTHWDREWYLPFESFRARLVDTIDRLLELLNEDPGYYFLLDGQTIILDDYLEIRPERRAELEGYCKAGRLALGPWYVQPDSFLPAAETHVRNLLEGRLAGRSYATPSEVAYTPDSFGHPAQFPQIFKGFDLKLFVYWRGNGNEIDQLPSLFLWQAPDGSYIRAYHMAEGYFNAASLPAETEAAAAYLEQAVRRLAEHDESDQVLLMNGVDHAPPDSNTGPAAESLARHTGWQVKRALLDHFAADLPAGGPMYRGEFCGARVANLLPGVWSARLPLKLRNHRLERLIFGWAEPWAALGHLLGIPAEKAALKKARRLLLQNQAHDSICGCSRDRVHRHMETRYDAAQDLAEETTSRILEHLSGYATVRRFPWSDCLDLAVFNPSPHSRTDVVRFPLQPSPWLEHEGEEERNLEVHPLLQAGLNAPGFAVDGKPARLLTDESEGRIHLLPESPPKIVEFIASHVPAFGWRRFRLEPAGAAPDQVDSGTVIEEGSIAVEADPDDGTFTVRFGKTAFKGICGIEDRGDRGDTYDFDPVGENDYLLKEVTIERREHECGLKNLLVRRVLSLPAGLTPERGRRSENRCNMVLETEACLAAGLPRLDLTVKYENAARDHRLRLLFPTGAPVSQFFAASTFDTVRRQTALPDDQNWVHPAPCTFPHQGFVSANGLTVSAYGLPEAEVTPEGIIAVTIVRAVGWLARHDLLSRPQPAGPAVPTPEAQCQGWIEAKLALFFGLDESAAADADLGLKAVVAQEAPLLKAGFSLLEIEPRQILLSALKPPEEGEGLILRLLNPSDREIKACIKTGFPLNRVIPIRIDENSAEHTLSVKENIIEIPVPPHALRSLLIT